MFNTLALISFKKKKKRAKNLQTLVCSTVLNFLKNTEFLSISELFKSIYYIFVYKDKKKEERRKERLAMGKR